ncbi:MAG: hypothetical protein ACTTH8_02645 [Treponema sp.]
MLLIFFYTFSASLIFIYGIGLERLSHTVHSGAWYSKKLLVDYAVIVVCASGVRLLAALLPNALLFTIPLIAAALFYGGKVGIDRLFNQTPAVVGEKTFSFALILFSVYYSGTYMETLIIIISGIGNLVLWSCIFCSIKKRVESANIRQQWKNAPLLLIGMGAAGLALYAWDSAWLTSVMF